MGKVLLVTSGKGGTGKSTVALNLASALSDEGKKCIILELDSGLRCLDLMLGIDSIVYDLGDVLKGRCDVNQAIYRPDCDNGISLVAAPAESDFVFDANRLCVLCKHFCNEYDFIILDTPAGLGKTLTAAATAADCALIVTNLSSVSVRDAEKTAQALIGAGVGSLRLVVNSVPLTVTDETEEIPDIDEIIDTVGVRLIALIPEDWLLRRAFQDRRSRDIRRSVGVGAFSNLAKRLLGQDVPLLIR